MAVNSATKTLAVWLRQNGFRISSPNRGEGLKSCILYPGSARSCFTGMDKVRKVKHYQA